MIPAISFDISKRLDMYSRKGDTFKAQINVKNSDGSLFDFTGYGASLDVYTNYSARTPILSFTQSGGLTLVEGAILLEKTWEEMNLRRGDYIYLLRIAYPNGTRFTWLNGEFEINESVWSGIDETSELTIYLNGTAIDLTIGAGGGTGGNTGGGGVWGTIEGSITDQTDLVNYVASLLPSDYSGGVTKDVNDIVKLGGDLFENVRISGSDAHGMWWDEMNYVRYNLGADKHFYMGTDIFELESTSGIPIDIIVDTALRLFGGALMVSDVDQDAQVSSSIHLAANNKALLLNVIADLFQIGTPTDGHVIFSEELEDVAMYANGVWTGVTKPKTILTGDTEVTLEPSDRNSTIVFNSNGDKILRLPAATLCKGFSVFVMHDDNATGKITIIAESGGTLNAFNNEIFVGGASIWQGEVGSWYASGSLGPFVDANEVQDAIDAGVQEAKDYADSLLGGTVYFVGTYATLGALQAAHPAGTAGQYGYVDSGAAADAQMYIWDESDTDWVLGGGGAIPDASSSVKGIARLYTNVAASNTDGSVSQAGIVTALAAKQNSLGYTAEDTANKSTSVTTDLASNTKYPSVKAVYDWAVSVFQTLANITLNVVTDKTSDTKYPSAKAVFTYGKTRGYERMLQGHSISFNDATTYYMGRHPNTPTTTQAIRKIYPRRAVRIKAVEIYTQSVTAGSNEAWEMYVRVNNTTDTLIASVSSTNGERIWTNTALDIAIGATDYYEIKIVCPTWTTNPLTTVLGGGAFEEFDD